MENWPVRYRLAVALVVPLLALAGLSALLVSGQAGAARAAARSQTAAQLTVKVNALLLALAEERYESSSYIGSGYRVMQAQTLAARGPVDEAVAAVRAQAAGLPGDQRLAPAVAAAEKATARLADLRRRIDGHRLAPGGGTDEYTEITRAWLAVTAAQSGVGTSDSQVVRTIDALTAISNVAEQASQQRGTVSILLILRRLDPDNFGLIRAASGAEAAWLGQFDSAASAGQRRLYTQVVRPTLAPVTQLRDTALRQAQTGAPVDVTGDAWLDAVDAKITALGTVQAQITTDLSDRAAALASRATARAWLAGLLAALVVAVTVAVSVVIARRLARQLRALREDALDLAERRLPAMAAAIRERRPVATVSPDDNTPVGNDEIGDVARSLREVYAAAVASATEVAAQRSVSASMRNLARRSQSLIHRQLKMITELERDSDADMLDRLFRLDHLATRMRREVEGQIALSGGRPSRVFRDPVALVDALRAAVAEVESYTRVEVSSTSDARIVGPVVGDVIHLLAELVENATQMSPENTAVSVTGSAVGTGVAVEIEDRGIGIPLAVLAELNARLADPPPFNPEQEGDKLGLWVIANLAARHGIGVRLSRSAYGGVTAVVLLPSEVLAAPGPGTAPEPAPAAAAQGTLARVSARDRLDMVGAGYDDDPIQVTTVLPVAPGPAAAPGPRAEDTGSIRAGFFTPPGRRPAPADGWTPKAAIYEEVAAAWAGAVTPPPAPPVRERPRPPALPTRAATRPGGPGEPALGQLPHRRRGENLSAELRAGRRAPTTSATVIDPERARGLVTSFRSGFQRGLPETPTTGRTSDASRR